MRAALALLALARARVSRPLLAQQVTWLYANSLDDASAFVADVLGLELATDQGPCRIYRSAPRASSACDSRARRERRRSRTRSCARPRGRRRLARLSGAQTRRRAARRQRDAAARLRHLQVLRVHFYDPNAATGLGLYC